MVTRQGNNQRGGARSCQRCRSYSRRLDELNQSCNNLYDFLLRQGYMPEQIEHIMETGFSTKPGTCKTCRGLNGKHASMCGDIG